MNLSLSFLGAAQNVTGSKHLIEADGKRIMVDCGMYQEHDFLKRNWEPFPVPPESIDALLLTHAHVDHCGLLPKLVRDGFRGKIYCTQATAEITEIMLMDAAKLQTEDAEFKKKRHIKENREGPHPEEPLYTLEDAERVTPLFAPVDYEKPFSPFPGIEVSLHEAGHVLGSAMMQVKVKQDGETRTMIFTGDVGSRNKPILRDRATFDAADYIIIESTYGDRLHDKPDDIGQALADIINDTHQRGGNIVVPSFALERAQEILYYLSELVHANTIPDITVYVDSPMTRRITEVFKRHIELYDKEMVDLIRKHQSPFFFPGLKIVETVEESKAINFDTESSMIIAGSGMITGGRIKHHLAANIDRQESTLLFVGYQASGTLGRYIASGAATVRLFGQEHKVRCQVKQIQGFSAHADRDGLLRWLSAFKKAPRRLFVTHGESDAAASFGAYVKEKLGWETAVPQYLDNVPLD